MKAMQRLPVLVAVACSGGGGTGAPSGPASDGSSGGDAVTSDAVSSTTSTSDGGGTDTDTNAGTTAPSTLATSAADAAAASTGNASTGNASTGNASTSTTSTTTAATSTATVSGTGTDSAVTSGGSSTTAGAVTGGTTGSGDAALSFATDIFPLWELVREPAWQYRGTGSYAGCNVDGVCHGGAAPGAGLVMADAPSTYAELIDVPSASTLCAGTLRVVAGDPEASCLVLFYQGRLGADDLGWVDDAEIELMREWIRQGALP